MALAPLIDCGLASVRAGARSYLDAYSIHPAIAAAGRADAGLPFQEAVDVEAAAYWIDNFRQASGDTAEGLVLTDILVRAGWAGVPYLLRQQRWAAAALLLETALLLNPSRSGTAALIPRVRQIVAHDPSQAPVLARALEVRNPGTAGTILLTALEGQQQDGDYYSASATASQLVYHCLNGGLVADAFAFAELAITFLRLAGTFPWTEMLAKVQRLQVYNALGHHDYVLTEVQRLREHALTLPPRSTLKIPRRSGTSRRSCSTPPGTRNAS